MQPERIFSRIERYLDEQLGFWTRILPWRRELTVHLEEAFLATQSKTTEVFNADMTDLEKKNEVAWLSALEGFGDVQKIAFQLREEHWPQYVGWRIFALLASVMVVFSMRSCWCLIDLPALGLTLGPMFAFLILGFCRGSVCWESANRVGAWAGLCGTVMGTAGMLTDMADPSNLGACMALSILSALYCVLFFAPRRAVIAGLISLTILNMGLVFFSLHGLAVSQGTAFTLAPYLPLQSRIDGSFVLQVMAVCGAVLVAGVARYGVHGIARQAWSVGTGVFLIALVFMLGDMSDPRALFAHFLVACGSLVLTTMSSLCLSDSARAIKKLL